MSLGALAGYPQAIGGSWGDYPGLGLQRMGLPVRLQPTPSRLAGRLSRRSGAVSPFVSVIAACTSPKFAEIASVGPRALPFAVGPVWFVDGWPLAMLRAASAVESLGVRRLVAMGSACRPGCPSPNVVV